MNYTTTHPRYLFPRDVYALRHTPPVVTVDPAPATTIPHPPMSYPGSAMPVSEELSPFSAALLASVLAGTTTLGKNLHQAKNGDMTVREAVVRALAEGAATTLSTTIAAGLASAINVGPAARLLIFAGTTTGIFYGLSAAAERTVKNSGDCFPNKP